MTTCPHCSAQCNPLKFLKVTKWTPYVCDKCTGKSDFPQKENIILGVVTGIIFFILAYLLSKVIGLFGLIPAVILTILLIPIYQYYFMYLEKIDDR